MMVLVAVGCHIQHQIVPLIYLALDANENVILILLLSNPSNLLCVLEGRDSSYLILFFN